ncbi:kelch-like protein 10 [Gigantopelta aegis]|uniref:kelch-like protein 10 n=1 Tax=Gigantopelta aegis TaxID=1735272 RepID=UPI001B88B160|nr:kelch-like protein 10 [Gigantopelta aegis]
MEQSIESLVRDFHNELNDMREQGLFCDIVINISDEKRKLYAHRAVLASSSPYFRGLFTSGFKESKQIEVEIPGITGTDMAEIIRYSYTRKAIVNPDNVESLLFTADRLHITGLIKYCCEYLIRNLEPGNVIGILKFSQYLGLPRLFIKAWNFLMQHFIQIVDTSSEFQQLSVDDLCLILEADDLNVPTEDDACLAALQWVNFSIDLRKCHYTKLLSSVRLGLVGKKTFDQYLMSNDYIFGSPDFKQLIKKGYKLCEINHQSHFSLLQGPSNPMLRPRVPYEVIFVVGGWSVDGVCGVLETYDTRADRWYRNTQHHYDENIAYHTVVSLGVCVYVIGGYSAPSKYFNAVKRFDCVSKLWMEIAPMHSKRCYVSGTTLDGLVYACGGFDGQTRHSSAERYNPSDNQWIMICPMQRVRSDAGACGLNGKLYVGGGFNGRDCLDSVEMYDPSEDQWTIIQPLSTLRSGAAFVTFAGFVYVIGGFSGMNRLRTVERYDASTNKWESTMDMTVGRSNFATAVCDDMIFVIGGFDGVGTTDKVECYDADEDEWFEAANLLIGRSATSACTISGLPNVRDYTFYGKTPNTHASPCKHKFQMDHEI